MHPCPLAGVNASPLRVGKDLVQEGISGRLENCSVWFLGLWGRRDASCGIGFAEADRAGLVFR